MYKKGVQKLLKWQFLSKKASFFKNPYKIQTNGARDLKLGFKNVLFVIQFVFRTFPSKISVQRASNFDNGPKYRSGTQNADTQTL